MTQTNADETDYKRAIENDATVQFTCECSHEFSYETFFDFNRARQDGSVNVTIAGEWAEALANGHFQAHCPSCGGEEKSVTLVRKPHDRIIFATESNSPNREVYFSPAASLSEKRAKYTDVIDKRPALAITCGCGFSDEFLDFNTFLHRVEYGDYEFEYSGDYLPYALAGNSFTLTCPECDGDGQQVTLCTQGGGFVLEMEISSAETCPSCDAYIQESGFKQGPDAPEIGWEYYECPKCKARTHPRTVE